MSSYDIQMDLNINDSTIKAQERGKGRKKCKTPSQWKRNLAKAKR